MKCMTKFFSRFIQLNISQSTTKIRKFVLVSVNYVTSLTVRVAGHPHPASRRTVVSNRQRLCPSAAC